MVAKDGPVPDPAPENNASIQPPTADSKTPVQTPKADTKAGKEDPFTPKERHQLTLYKWRYALEAYGFEAHEVEDLMFLKWLHKSGRVLP